MGDPIITVEGLGKQYRIGVRERGYSTLRDVLADAVRSPFRRRNGGRPGTADGTKVWALRNVSFDVQSGEILGIIGRNGAGKSTLLKLLSRITEPTEGRAVIRGRVASLLEVGTGFHPELTGRENIALNGAILGMSRREIARNFDAIVAFAEIPRFIDTPVKHYSSGMYLRLAFAVAAHLEPEILLVDEVLAVGDAAFQEKCMDKMGTVARGGRTVLFVSHNMTAINRLCKRALLIDGGTILRDGSAGQVIQAYLDPQGVPIAQKTWRASKGPGNGAFRLLSVALKSPTGDLLDHINISEEARVEIEYEVLLDGTRAQFSLVLFDAHGSCVFGSLSNTPENQFHGRGLRRGKYRTTCHLHGNLLNSGRYHISVIGTSEFWHEGFRADHAISFDAEDDGILRRDYAGEYGGVVRPRLPWTTVCYAQANEG